jgi:diadenosine tetraphosphate (Ap4A) HIT family hydrolase
MKEDKEKLLGHMMLVSAKVAEQEGCKKDGFRVVINQGMHAC